jgi:hypothetical protein
MEAIKVAIALSHDRLVILGLQGAFQKIAPLM